MRHAPEVILVIISAMAVIGLAWTAPDVIHHYRKRLARRRRSPYRPARRFID